MLGEMVPDQRSARLEELLAGLNEPQREAVTHGEGPLLILAGAGSGKTRALTHRVAYLIFSGLAQPAEILAITFTNKAANEMRQRVELLLGRSTRGMWLSTFHAACVRILRADAQRLGYTRQFTIYDQADARRLIKRCITELGIDPKRFTPAAIDSQISDAKNKLRDAADYRKLVDSYFEQTVADVYELYERELHRMNAMDFDDLLVRTVNLFELFDEVRERYSTAFGHVLVDEYQDTNRAQYRLLQLLVAPLEGPASDPGDGSTAGALPERNARSLPGHRNLAVVGDDSQAIYGFRGADVRNILDFQVDFPDARVVKLEQNYRSTQTILSAANAVIANNRGALAKRLWSSLGDGDPIHVRELADEHAEARYIVGEIERLLDEGSTRSEIAVFYRTNAMSRVVEDALVRREIAYQVIGGTKFYERAEIKDAIAYLTLLANPQDVVSFTRVANSPRRGIGQTSLARLIAHAAAIGVSVWEAAAKPDTVPGLGTAAVKALGRFMDTMEQLREMSRAASVGDLLEAVLARTGYVRALEAERTFEAQGRIENLEELVRVAREFDATADTSAPEDLPTAPAADERAGAEDLGEAGRGVLDLFLAQIALVADSDARRDDERLVTLMTLHNAKGLEYPIVFIAGCEDGVFPHSRALDEGGLEEERRLFYVGLTRAMRQLYLTYARRRSAFGAQSYGLRSRFLDEVPGELTEVQEDLFLRAVGAGTGAASAIGASTVRRDGAWRAASTTDRAVPVSFRLGEDVVHAAFGDGVVTGVEADGVIVVRFAADGSERKLMAEYAPVTRR
jgi:DNA helicase-2/ATP-dependent DNA helicase PcrA